jgi:pimeloyl-ACP methyl ester carboxylesterase
LEQIASKVGPAGINVAYERFGNANAPVVLLIMGGGAQMISWPDAFCQALVDHGLQVIRFDNRDVGRSTHITDAPPPNLQAVLAGDLSSASYTLSDMAADTIGLMDALGVETAHVVGASLGGAIAQTMAIEHPSRVRSLTSMMASSGNMAVGQPSPDAMRQLAGRPPAVTREQVIEQMLQAFRVIGSPRYPMDEEEVAARVGLAYDRSHDPLGHARQAIAFVASGDRTERLRQLNVPTLVIHGLADGMCDVSGGRAVAEAIPGAELVLIEGMGHNLPPGLREQLAERIGSFVLRHEAQTA